MSKRKNNKVFAGDGQGSPTEQWQGQRSDIMAEFGLDIAHELVPLPSQGRPYPSDHPLHMKEVVEIRPMTAREEDILTSRALIKKGVVLTELLKSCLVDKRINPDSLLIGDRNAIMTSLRITGYGSDYKVEVTCPSCSAKSKQTFDLTQLPLKRLENDPVAEGANVFETTLPKRKETDPELVVRYKYLTGKDETDINILQERKKKQGFSADNLITTRYKYQVVSINGVSDRSKLSMFIDRMPAFQSRHLRKAIDANEPGVEMKSHMNCPSCFEESEVSLPLGASFFWPDAE